MPDTISVRPVRDADGTPRRVPRAPKVLLRLAKDGEWPVGAILADGEQLKETPYIKSLIRTGDLVADSAPIKASPSRRSATSKPSTEPEKSGAGMKPAEK